MAISEAVLDKLNNLHDEQIKFVISLVDQMSRTPEEVFDSLCEQGLENPMTENEIDNIIKEVRDERRATADCS